MKTNSKKDNVFRYILLTIIVVLSLTLLFGCDSSKATSELPNDNSSTQIVGYIRIDENVLEVDEVEIIKIEDEKASSGTQYKTY